MSTKDHQRAPLHVVTLHRLKNRHSCLYLQTLRGYACTHPGTARADYGGSKKVKSEE